MYVINRPRKLLMVAILAGPIAAAGCASSAAGSESSNAPAPGPDLDRLEALYQARADSALLVVSEADVDFMTGMIHHHAQALVMSALAPGNGASAALLTLTSRITNAQKDEIAVMQRWLRERGRPVPAVDADGRMSDQARGGMTMPGMTMPGMLSPAQLEDLAVATGAEYDRLFLTYMIQHHNGAVSMVHELFASDGAAQDEFVFKIASDIQVDQITEVARMQQMLDSLPSDNSR